MKLHTHVFIYMGVGVSLSVCVLELINPKFKLAFNFKRGLLNYGHIITCTILLLHTQSHTKIANFLVIVCKEGESQKLIVYEAVCSLYCFKAKFSRRKITTHRHNEDKGYFWHIPCVNPETLSEMFLPQLKSKRTVLFLSGLKYVFQMKSNFAAYFEIIVLEFRRRAERPILHGQRPILRMLIISEPECERNKSNQCVKW